MKCHIIPCFMWWVLDENQVSYNSVFYLDDLAGEPRRELLNCIFIVDRKKCDINDIEASA